MRSFLTSPCYHFTSESVTEGHPDKLCDQVSDAILDEIMAKDPLSRVAVETAVTNGLVVVMGEVTTECYVEIPDVVRGVVRDAGYTHPEYRFDYQSCGVLVSIQGQSTDIDAGVSQSLECREGSRDPLDCFGAGDQGMMVGYACSETPEFMPMSIALAHKLCRRMAQVRKEGLLPYLRPDGKSQVTVEYRYGVPKRVEAIILAANHNEYVNDAKLSQEKLRQDLMEAVIKPVVPSELMDKATRIYANTAGPFIIGGPAADTGVTGRKILVDTYGGFARVGGGCFSGKDPTKVDRSGAYMARYVAKNLVAAGIAERLEIQVAYAIGKARPVALCVETFGGGKIPDERIEKLIGRHFDLRPAAILEHLQLRRPVFRQTAVYGHFGREEPGFTWEVTDKAQALREDAGLG